MKVKDTRPLVGQQVVLTHIKDGRQIEGVLTEAGSISTFIRRADGTVKGVSNLGWNIERKVTQC